MFQLYSIFYSCSVAFANSLMHIVLHRSHLGACVDLFIARVAGVPVHKSGKSLTKLKSVFKRCELGVGFGVPCMGLLGIFHLTENPTKEPGVR